MKKYKHKRTGITASPFQQSYQLDSGNIVPSFMIEDSCDWQEVIEKDYEILSIKCKIENFGDYILNKISNGKFANEYKQIEFNNQFYSIYSVKRNSDGEVFTVGDKITYGKNTKGEGKIIESFHFKYNKIYIKYECDICKFDDWLGSNFQHYKQPLLTTRDGVDIFKGDIFYFVTTNNAACPCYTDKDDLKYHDVGYNFSTLEACEDYIKSITPIFTTEDGVDIFEGDKTCWINNWTVTNFTDWKRNGNTKELHFSTKEAAEEYILLNKPCLSINDLSDYYYTGKKSLTLKKLKDLVKSKL